jgi:hypothetical protein
VHTRRELQDSENHHPWFRRGRQGFRMEAARSMTQEEKSEIFEELANKAKGHIDAALNLKNPSSD